MNFRSKERVLPKAFAKIEVNDEKSIVALYVENLKNLKDGYDVIALRTDYERLNLGRINLNSQGKGEFVLDLGEDDSDIKAIALTYDKYVPLIGFKGNKIENYEELIFEPEEEIEEYTESDEEEYIDRNDVYEEVEYVKPDEGEYEYEEVEYIYEDDLDNEDDNLQIQDTSEPEEIQQTEEVEPQDTEDIEEYEYIEYEEPEYEYEYEEVEYIYEDDLDNEDDNLQIQDTSEPEEIQQTEEVEPQDTEDIEEYEYIEYEEPEYEYEEVEEIEETNQEENTPNQQSKPKKECAKPLQMPKDERDNNIKPKQQKLISKDRTQNKRKNMKQEQYNQPKTIQKSNTDFDEKLSAGKLLMPRQIKKGLKYFKEVKPFAADYIPNTRWWKIEITPTTMSGYTIPYLGYVNSLNYTMYSDIAMNSYKYRHYLFGVQYDEYNKRKNYIYAIPGKKSEQPDKGTTGFTTYQTCDNRSTSLGYWLCFIDSKARKIEK